LVTSSGKVCIHMVCLYTVSVSNRFFFSDMALIACYMVKSSYMRHLQVIIINTGD
jgi:hypothetical protein